MAKARKAKDDRNEIPRLIEKQYKDLFSDQDTPPAPINLREMQALQARVAILEAELAKRPDAAPEAAGTPAAQPGTGTPAPAEQAAPVAFEPDIEEHLGTEPVATQRVQHDAPAPLHSAPAAPRPALSRLTSGIASAAREFGKSKIQTRLTFLILIVTLPVLIGVTAFISNWAESKMEAGANEDLKQNSDAMATNISTWYEQNVLTLQEMASLPGITNMDPVEQVPVLKAVAKAHPYMYLVSTTGLSGMNVARNDDAAPIDYRDRTWYQDAVAGAPVSLQVLIGKTSGRPALVVSAPIRNSSGAIAGVGMFAADLSNLSEQTRVTRLGQTGYVYLVDANNQVLAHPDPAFTTGKLRNLSSYLPVVALRQGKTGLISFTDQDHVAWRAYLRPLDNGWAVITQQQEREILAPARQFQGIAYVLIALGTLAMLGLSWLSIRRTLQPIAVLTDTVSAIAAGDLSRTVAVASRDEIGVLASTFNSMASRLRNTITTLEQRVADRTHDLQLASEVGRAVSEKSGDIYSVLKEAVELIGERFDLYYTQIYLTNQAGTELVLRAGTGQVGAELLRRGHHLSIGSGSLNGRAASEKRPVIVADTLSSPGFLPNPLLPDTRSEMSVPLIAGGRILGVLDMQSRQGGEFNETNLDAFQILAGQLAVALQNASLFAEAEDARAQMGEQVRRMTEQGWRDFLNAIERGEQLGFAVDAQNVVPLKTGPLPESSAENSINTPITLTGARIGAIQLAGSHDHTWTEGEIQIVQAAAAQLAQHIDGLRLLAQAEQYRSRAEDAARRLTREGWEAYSAKRLETAPGYEYDLNQVKPLAAGSNGHTPEALSRQLVVRNETIGELIANLDTRSDEAAEILAAVAEQMSSHIENLRLSEQNEKRAHEMQAVAELSATTSSVLDPDSLIQTIADRTKERFGLYHAHIYLANDSWQTLLLAAGSGEVGRQLVAQEHAIAFNAEQSLVARAARERQAVIINDVRNEPGFLPNPLLPGTRAELAVPMIVGDKVLGVFDVQSDRVSGFSDEDAGIYTTLASQVAVALQNARLYVEQAATVTQLRELDRLKSSFLANMSHELRTPLNSILGFADVILTELDGPLTENMSNDLQLIQKNGQHLLHLINDVLDMAKIEAGRMNLVPEKFVVKDVLDEVVSITSTLAGDKQVDVCVAEESDAEISLLADRTRVRQVMINLVNNAIKFTDNGRISIEARREGEGAAVIAVKDTGIGIPPDKLEAIFQEFAQIDTSTTRKAGGTGLGLPISRRLVEMHGGRLWAESAGVAGQGSTFYVELPLVAQITEPVERMER